MLQGQTVMQMAQPKFSLKNGMHLSKSTYHLYSPRTGTFSGRIASGGQAFAQTWQRLQKSSTPYVTLGVGIKGTFVSTAASLNDEPYSLFMMEPCLPSSPKPHSSAGGIINNGPARGPACGAASQPRCLIHVAMSLLALLALPYWRTTSAPAGAFGAVRHLFVVVGDTNHDCPLVIQCYPFIGPLRLQRRDTK